jgi:hypothetical protein
MQLADMAKAELNATNEDGIWEETVVIVDDCRYPNEVEAARQFQALTLFVYAGGREIPESEAAWRAHESEEMSQRIEGGDLDGAEYFDWAIVNSGSVDELEEKLEKRRDYLTGIVLVMYASVASVPRSDSIFRILNLSSLLRLRWKPCWMILVFRKSRRILSRLSSTR